MLRDARAHPPPSVLEADLAIVGSGAAGIALARELAGTPARVVLLESGGLGFEAEDHALLVGELAGIPSYPLDSSRLRLFGGTTNHWSGTCWPFEPIDLAVRPEVPFSGWPLSRADLDPYYERAQRVCQLGPFDYDAKRWAAAAGQPLLPLDPEVVPTRIHQIHATRFAFLYRDELEQAGNVEIVLHAEVLEVETDAQGRRATGLRVAVRGGEPFRVKARHVVLAAGGIDNPRLLLLSRGDGAHPAGLGNARDLVGRFFMDHLKVVCGLLLPADPELSLAFYRPGEIEGVRVSGVLGLSEAVLREEGLLSFSANLRPFRGTTAEREAMFAEDSESVAAAREIARSVREGSLPPDLGAHLQALLGDLGGIARGARRRLAGGGTLSEGVGQVYLECIAEQAPNPESRVTLGEGRDAFGRPRARLAWRLSELDHRSIRRATEILGREAGRTGLGRVRVLVGRDAGAWSEWSARGPWEGPTSSYHHMGTTRMHEDPLQGVVDPDCRVHGLENLWIAGSSVFPTGSCVNPTLTLVALALRLADRLALELA
jgi:choline dehydrogenase-like flavoprotein